MCYIPTQNIYIYSLPIDLLENMNYTAFYYMIILKRWVGFMELVYNVQPIWRVAVCMNFGLFLWEYIWLRQRGVRRSWQPYRGGESFVHIINRGGAAATEISHCRRYTLPLLRRHMSSSGKCAVTMVKCTKTKAPKIWEPADPCSHTTVGGARVGSHILGALVIDLIFTSNPPWLRTFCGESVMNNMPRWWKRAAP